MQSEVQTVILENEWLAFNLYQYKTALVKSDCITFALKIHTHSWHQNNNRKPSETALVQRRLGTSFGGLWWTRKTDQPPAWKYRSVVEHQVKWMSLQTVKSKSVKLNAVSAQSRATPKGEHCTPLYDLAPSPKTLLGSQCLQSLGTRIKPIPGDPICWWGILRWGD